MNNDTMAASTNPPPRIPPLLLGLLVFTGASWLIFGLHFLR